jgi:hypothetical protein
MVVIIFLDNYDDLDFIRIYIFWIQTTVSDRSPYRGNEPGTRAKLGSESQGSVTTSLWWKLEAKNMGIIWNYSISNLWEYDGNFLDKIIVYLYL